MKTKPHHLICFLLTVGLGLLISEGAHVVKSAVRSYFSTTNNTEIPQQALVSQQQDEVDVYRTVIQKYATERASILAVKSVAGASEFFTIESNRDGLTAAQFFEQVNRYLPVTKETTDNYLLQNETPSELNLDFLGFQYKLVSEQEVEKFFHDGGEGWRGFYQKYPHASGLITLSRIGFNRDHTEAFVYDTYSCGGLCGEGNYVVLTKIGSVWWIQDTACIWES